VARGWGLDRNLPAPPAMGRITTCRTHHNMSSVGLALDGEPAGRKLDVWSLAMAGRLEVGA
jgi:hypothetical protein